MSTTALAGSIGRSGRPIPPQRGDEAELFRRYAGRLIADTRRSVKTSHAVIEDACAFAWVQLLCHQPERDILFGWLRKTAVREALRLVAAGRRVASLEVVPEPARRDGPDSALEFRAALDAVARAGLSARQERILGLAAGGHSYREIAALTWRRAAHRGAPAPSGAQQAARGAGGGGRKVGRPRL